VDKTPITRVAPYKGNSNVVYSFAPIVKKVVPSVVNISTTKVIKGVIPPQMREFFNDPFFRRFFGVPPIPQREKIHALGSGVIITPDGYIVTNNHVVSGATKIIVKLHDGREYTAKVVGTDPQTDLAVLKIDAKNLTPITFGDSSQIEVGDIVLAIGNPFGLGESVTEGIVSGVNRNSLGINTYENYIQTDAPINPGNSGGALVDLKGRLIGINTAILSKSGGNNGIGFAIPSNMVRKVALALIKYKKVTRGYLGVLISNIDVNKQKLYGVDHGVLVNSVMKGSPAEKAGLQPGDIIVEVNGKKVTDGAELRNIIAFTTPGTVVKLKVYRNGKYLTIPVKIGKYTPQQLTLNTTFLKGVTVKQEGDKVVIEKVNPNSYLSMMGIQQGDVIEAVKTIKTGKWVEIHSISQLQDLLKGVGRGDVLMRLKRGNEVIILQF
jgi:serine protease Do